MSIKTSHNPMVFNYISKMKAGGVYQLKPFAIIGMNTPVLDKIIIESLQDVEDKLSSINRTTVYQELHKFFKKNGSRYPITIIPIDNSTNTSSTATIKLSGTVSKKGNLILNLNTEKYYIPVEVNDNHDTIITKIKGAIDVKADTIFNAQDITDPTAPLQIKTNDKGSFCNKYKITLDLNDTEGLTSTITDFTGGITSYNISTLDTKLFTGLLPNYIVLEDFNKDIGDALIQFNNTIKQDVYHGEFRAFHGNNDSEVNDIIALTKDRDTDDTTVQCVAPDSPETPFAIALEYLSVVFNTLNVKGAAGLFTGEQLDLKIGDDKYSYNDTIERDRIFKGGSSTTQIVGGFYTITEIITPADLKADEPNKYLVNFNQLRQLEHMTKQMIANQELLGKSVVEDITVISRELQPYYIDLITLKSLYVNLMADALRMGIIYEPVSPKEDIIVENDPSNSNKINVTVYVTLAKGLRILKTTYNYMHKFG